MERGLYIAATGMMSAMVQQDIIANNLANVNTSGYKADRAVNETFADSLLHSMRNGGEVIGRLNHGTRVAGTVTDFAQGSMRATQQPLNLAIGGDGFFQVRQDDGTIAYSRNGELARSPEGFLVNQEGQFILGRDKLPVSIGTEGDPVIKRDGTVQDHQGRVVGQIGLVTLNIPTARKVGDNLWVGVEVVQQPARTEIRQGFLEGSSVNSVKEMVQMINTMRSYESAQKAIVSIDGALEKSINSVGNING